LPPADCSLHDACLLAALAALSSLRLHAVTVDDTGRIQRAAEAEAAGQKQQRQQEGQQQQQLRRLDLGCQPVSLTCGTYRGRLLVDPTAEEEPLLEALLTATVDQAGAILGKRVRAWVGGLVG
jgi:exosome complex RNA-binding protein Rrp42 (RNase PH superfamily)